MSRAAVATSPAPVMLAPPTARPVAPAPLAPDAARATGGSSFHAVLSELNPLQYVPVVGTLYRSLTGDTIPEPVRVMGSMAVSGLTGGPAGLAIGIGLFGAEKLTGIDPERIGQKLLAGVGLGHAPPAAPATVLATNAAAQPQSHAAAGGWSSTQLAAYGVTTAAGGELQCGGLTGCDVLNALELAQLGTAWPGARSR